MLFIRTINGRRSALNLIRAWQIIAGKRLSASPIRVGVIDSGVDFSHTDLIGRLLPGKNYITPNSLPYDDYGHGTHVSGIIGAVVNNATGIAGSSRLVLIDPRKIPGRFGQGQPHKSAQCDL